MPTGWPTPPDPKLKEMEAATGLLLAAMHRTHWIVVLVDPSYVKAMDLISAAVIYKHNGNLPTTLGLVAFKGVYEPTDNIPVLLIDIAELSAVEWADLSVTDFLWSRTVILDCIGSPNVATLKLTRGERIGQFGLNNIIFLGTKTADLAATSKRFFQALRRSANDRTVNPNEKSIKQKMNEVVEGLETRPSDVQRAIEKTLGDSDEPRTDLPTR